MGMTPPCTAMEAEASAGTTPSLMLYVTLALPLRKALAINPLPSRAGAVVNLIWFWGVRPSPVPEKFSEPPEILREVKVRRDVCPTSA